MSLWLELLPWLLAMAVLVGLSAFFSASEAALFSLRRADRRLLAAGSRPQRLAISLLDDPDRLLTAILFWNLMVNMAYFAASSIVAFYVEQDPQAGSTSTYLFAGGSLLVIIFCSEMLPKTLAVLAARRLAGVFAPPLVIAVQLMAPLLPALRLVNLLSRRLIWPRFQPELYLDLTDLERAIDVSSEDAQLVQQERMVLNNLVAMSDIRVDEWMRPRTQFLLFRPPVSWRDLRGQMTPSGYLLVSSPDGDVVQAALDLQNLTHLPPDHLEQYAQPVIYLPWCATVADAFQQLYQQDREVAAVVNEFGDTIGILTFEDILDTVFTDTPSRSARLLNRRPVELAAEGVWHVTGVAGIRRLAREMGVQLPPTRNTTVAGVIQESLHRLPLEGDEAVWGPFRFRVLEVTDRARMLVELTRQPAEEEERES